MAVNDSSQYALALQAEVGDVSAQYRLGVLFLLGSGVEQDTEAACRWLLAAAEGHHRDAQLLVEKLAPFLDRDASDGSTEAKTPRVLQNWLAVLTHMTKATFDGCEEATRHSMDALRRCLMAKMPQAHSDAGTAARRTT